MSDLVPAPMLGATELLVYGECECGWRCACPEGARWPQCPLCGEQVMPPLSSGPLERLGYIATLTREQAAVDALASAGPTGVSWLPTEPARHFTAVQMRAEREARDELARDA